MEDCIVILPDDGVVHADDHCYGRRGIALRVHVGCRALQYGDVRELRRLRNDGCGCVRSLSVCEIGKNYQKSEHPYVYVVNAHVAVDSHVLRHERARRAHVARRPAYDHTRRVICCWSREGLQCQVIHQARQGSINLKIVRRAQGESVRYRVI